MDGVRAVEGGEGVTGAMIRARIRVDGRLAGGLQALLGAGLRQIARGLKCSPAAISGLSFLAGLFSLRSVPGFSWNDASKPESSHVPGIQLA